ncbi:kelch repeat-containing protein [Niabella insulamsoli]|uniref:kelch repeat-containing protein n=1 Tax=Niabella insulamsoli TaxID=3144874 RepID=UPI0031FC5E44
MILSLLACKPADTSSLKWTVAGTLPADTKGLAGPVVGVLDNKLIIAGGCNFPDSMPWLGGRKKYYKKGYFFSKEKALAIVDSFDLPFDIAYASSCTTDRGIVVAGGENENGISNKTFLIRAKPSGGVEMDSLRDLPFALTNAAVTALGNKIYLAGGELPEMVSDKFLTLDLDNIAKGWQPLPPLRRPVSHAVMVAQHNGAEPCIYLIGGRKRNAGGISDLYADVDQFDIAKNEWKQKHSLPYALSAGTGIAAGTHGILLFGGDQGATFHQTESLIAAIDKEQDAARKQQLVQQKINLQFSHPGFSGEILNYNTIDDRWSIVDSLPFPTPVTTTAVRWNDAIWIPGGEIKAGVRTTQILSATFTE